MNKIYSCDFFAVSNYNLATNPVFKPYPREKERWDVLLNELDNIENPPVIVGIQQCDAKSIGKNLDKLSAKVEDNGYKVFIPASIVKEAEKTEDNRNNFAVLYAPKIFRKMRFKRLPEQHAIAIDFKDRKEEVVRIINWNPIHQQENLEKIIEFAESTFKKQDYSVKRYVIITGILLPKTITDQLKLKGYSQEGQKKPVIYSRFPYKSFLQVHRDKDIRQTYMTPQKKEAPATTAPDIYVWAKSTVLPSEYRPLIMPFSDSPVSSVNAPSTEPPKQEKPQMAQQTQQQSIPVSTPSQSLWQRMKSIFQRVFACLIDFFRNF